MISARRAPVLFPPCVAVGPGACVSAELSRTVSFSDLATREMQLNRDQKNGRSLSLSFGRSLARARARLSFRDTLAAF